MTKFGFNKIYDYDYETELNEVKDICNVDDQDYKKETRINDSYNEYKENLEY